MDDLEKKLVVLEKKLNKLELSLNCAEGNIGILQMSHRGYVNYNPVEFANMHGYRIENLTSPADRLPAGVSEYVHPDAFQSRSKMIRYAMQFADEMSYQIRTDEDGDATVTAQALIEGLVELAGLKLEVS